MGRPAQLRKCLEHYRRLLDLAGDPRGGPWIVPRDIIVNPEQIGTRPPHPYEAHQTSCRLRSRGRGSSSGFPQDRSQADISSSETHSPLSSASFTASSILL